MSNYLSAQPVKLFLISTILVVSAWFLQGCTRVTQTPSEQSTWQLARQVPDKSMQQLQIGDHQLTVEVVNTSASITRGLSGRDHIGKTGMLFVLPSASQPAFWMKDMKFDLDLVWIGNDQVREITRQAPALDVALSELPVYQPSQPINLVLEVPSDQNWQFEVGDKVQFLVR